MKRPSSNNHERPRRGRPAGLGRHAAILGAFAFTFVPAVAILSIPASVVFAQSNEPAPGNESDERPIVLIADQVTYDRDAGTVTASGQVEISRDDQILRADEVIYDQIGKRLFASGNIALLDGSETTYFGERAEITDDFADGIIERFSALFEENARIASREAVRRESRFNELDDAVFSPCPVCAEDPEPLWQIRASRVIHDEKEKTITYKNARLEFFGIPLLYTPYLSHPDPTVERKTGFLIPTFGNSSILGFNTQVPYFIDLGPSRDITLTPLLSTDVEPFLALEFRDLQTFGKTTVTGSFTHTDEYRSDPDDVDGKELRYNIDAKGDYRFGDLDSGFQLRLASDNSYLSRYGISNANVLRNRLFAQNVLGPDFWTLEALGFQSLRVDEPQGEIPIVLPLAESRLESSPLAFGGRASLDTSMVALSRTSGLDSRRLSSEAGIDYPFAGRYGDFFNLRISARGDAYSYTGNPQDFSDQDDDTDSAFRLLPRATLDWKWPLIGETGSWQHIIEPIAMLTLTPEAGNDRDIPNEDSQVFELDETNVFEPVRFPGYDRVDGGARAAYGFRFDSLSAGGLNVSGTLGQSYQPEDPTGFPDQSGVRSGLSDVVGRIDFRPSSLVDLSYRFRVDPDDFAARRNDVVLTFGPPAARFNLGYLSLSDDPVDLAPEERQELRAGLRLQLSDEFAVGAQTRIDLEGNDPISHMLGLLYTNDCVIVSAGLEKRFTQRAEVEDETRFTLRINLIGLGTQAGTGIGS